MNTAQNAQLNHLRRLKTGLYAILALLLLMATVAAWTGIHAPQTAPVTVGCGVSSLPSDPRYAQGKELFLANCASCHHKNMRDNLTGPAIGQALEAWKKYPAGDQYAYIRNNQALLHKRHPRAVKVWKAYQPVVMPAFPALTDAELEALLAYVRYQNNAD